MPHSPVDPSRLSGQDLRRWYMRNPAEIEKQRQEEAVRRHRAFFGRLPTPDPVSGFRRESPPVAREQESGPLSPIWLGRYDDPDPNRGPGSEIFDRSVRRIQPLRVAKETLQSLGGKDAARAAPSAGGPPSNPLSGLAAGPGAPQPQSVEQLPHHAIWMAGRQPGDLDPSRTEVFELGIDGKLHPVPGWRTTGPFDVGAWSKMFDWEGVAQDLTGIGAGAIDFLAGGGLAAEVLGGLGYRIGPDFIRGVIEGHHAFPKFMGGPNKQDLARLFQSLHREFHAELSAALKKADFPRVGGQGGGTTDWAEFFKLNDGKRDEALQILRDVSRSFDRRRGTRISKSLDAALTRSEGPPPTPPN